MTEVYLCTGLGLPPEYLGSRALTELQPPPSTIGSSEFPFSIDGEYWSLCVNQHHVQSKIEREWGSVVCTRAV